jgi:hypothetical protein
MPRRHHIARDQSATHRSLAGGGYRHQSGSRFISRSRLVVQLGGDEFVDRACASLRFVADRDGYPATDHASVGLPVAETSHIRHRGACQCSGLCRINLRIRRSRLGTTAWQQHTNDAQPKSHSQKEKHDPTHYPRRLSAALNENLAERLEAVVGDEATFLDKIDANTMRI